MLNQLDNLAERVRGSNKLVDRWLHVRKHLLVAYYLSLIHISLATRFDLAIKAFEHTAAYDSICLLYTSRCSAGVLRDSRESMRNS